MRIYFSVVFMIALISLNACLENTKASSLNFDEVYSWKIFKINIGEKDYLEFINTVSEIQIYKTTFQNRNKINLLNQDSIIFSSSKKGFLKNFLTSITNQHKELASQKCSFNDLKKAYHVLVFHESKNLIGYFRVFPCPNLNNEIVQMIPLNSPGVFYSRTLPKILKEEKVHVTN